MSTGDLADEFLTALPILHQPRTWRSTETLSSSRTPSYLKPANSRSKLLEQSPYTFNDDSFTYSSERRSSLDGWLPPDPRFTICEDDDYNEKQPSHLPYSAFPAPYTIDEEAALGYWESSRYSTADTFQNLSALTSTGNLILEKLAEDENLPVPIADPALAEPEELPTKIGIRAYRYIRWNFFSVYRRLFTTIFMANVATLIVLLCHRSGPHHTRGASFNTTSTIDAASVNLLLAILMRNEHVINFLFWLSSALPLSSPLLLRRWAAKIYTYGGVHSGCSVAALVWYIAFTALATYDSTLQSTTTSIRPAVVALSYIILSLLVLISIFAHPFLRQKLHDYFEATHRFAGWAAIALFWAQVILSAHYTTISSPYTTLGTSLATNPPFYCLLIITACIIYPWTRLRNHTPRIEPLSPHALRLHFNHTNLSYCQGVRLTDAPLKENHAFAAIPNKPSEGKGFSVVISNAGDWTKKIITTPPSTIYIKGAPVYGVLRVAAVFSPVVIVATGSGIGPCLSLFNGRPDLNVRILWSTPSPLKTYGQAIIDGVLAADPNAVIVDTRAGPIGEDGKRKSVRPDMVRLTYGLWKRSAAEAVVVISNPKVTRKVVYGMECRGVPAFGPIWDS